MNTIGKIHTGLGIALTTVLVCVAGCVSGDSTDDGPTGVATEAQFSPPGLRCTVSSGLSPTGREWARLVITRERGGEVLCSRVRIGGPAPEEYPSCHQRRFELGCTIIVD